jgi:hypothetical protein
MNQKFYLNAIQLLPERDVLLLRENIMNIENLKLEDIMSIIAGKRYS